MVIICLSIIIVLLCIFLGLGYAWVNKRHPKNDLNNGGANFVDLHLEKKNSKPQAQNVDDGKIPARKYKTNNIVDLSQPTAEGVKDNDSDVHVIYKNDESNKEPDECSGSNELTGDASNEDLYPKSDEIEVDTKRATQEAENINENVSKLQTLEPSQIEGQSNDAT